MAISPSNLLIYASKPQYTTLCFTIGNTGSKWCIYYVINQDISVDKCMHIVYTIQYNMRITEKDTMRYIWMILIGLSVYWILSSFATTMGL